MTACLRNVVLYIKLKSKIQKLNFKLWTIFHKHANTKRSYNNTYFCLNLHHWHKAKYDNILKDFIGTTFNKK